MSVSKQESLSGWGRYPVETCETFRPEKRRELHGLVRDHPQAIIARGLGRSYGDASLQPTGTVRTERLDHIIHFDPAAGILTAQAGVTFSELLDLCIPKGWLIPAIPGTRHITLGGAVACNVHGKNQFRDGDFGEHVREMRVMLAGGESVMCSPDYHSDLFWATVGGMGMTGIIEEVTIQLKHIPSASLRTTTYRVNFIEEMVAAFQKHRSTADYMVGWIDHTARGGRLGNGVFEAATHITTSEGGADCKQFKTASPRFSVPFDMPSWLLNRHTMAIYNGFRFRKYGFSHRVGTSDLSGFFHPLDGISQWNRLYGKHGFLQYQCLIPETKDTVNVLNKLLSLLHGRDVFSFLAVMKYHRAGKNMLPFSQAGYSLALDFPNTEAVEDALPEIDRFVAEHGGRIYLAKDAMLDAAMFRRMYGRQAEAWMEVIHACDPLKRFYSLMSKRLEWKVAHDNR